MFSRMGLSNRLILIVLGINIIILLTVAYLANTSSDAALRNQALERFDTKSNHAYLYIDSRLQGFQRAAQSLVDWVET